MVTLSVLDRRDCAGPNTYLCAVVELGLARQRRVGEVLHLIGQATTPTAGTHTIAFDFQSASNSLTTTLACASSALGILRVAAAVA